MRLVKCCHFLFIFIIFRGLSDHHVGETSFHHFGWLRDIKKRIFNSKGADVAEKE